MKTKSIIIVLIVMALSATSIYASETNATNMNKEMDPEYAKMMEQWEKYMTPSDGHKVLEKLVGTWNHTMQHWMSPDSPAEGTSGTSEISWIMDGRYVQHSVNGSWNGQPFKGMGIIGYDNITKEYNTIWLDNMGTGIMQANGTYNRGSNSIGEAGAFSCPMTNSTRKYRAITKFIDDNTYTYETYMTDPSSGKEFRSMLITYTRN